MMLNADLLFVEILRFIACAFMLLGASMIALRFLKQPVERIRLIQISLVALLVTIVIGAAGVVPTISLPVLVRTSSDAEAVKAIETGNRPQRLATGSDSEDLSQHSPEVAAIPANEMRHSSINKAPFDATAASEAACASAISTSRFELMPWVRGAFVLSFLFVSLLNVIYLLIGFVATRRLIHISTPLTESAAARVRQIVSELSIARRVHFVSSETIDTPMVSGIWRPTSLLPEALTRNGADPLELKHSVSHEWAHIERRDLLTWQLANDELARRSEVANDLR